MENENIGAIVQHAFNDNPASMRDALYNEINDRIFAAIEQKKQAIAANIVTQHEPE